jgi:hypothetical protein
MKSIHAVSNILAVWRIGSSASGPERHASRPVQTSALRVKGGQADESNSACGCTNSAQSPAALSTLLAVALLQGVSSADRRRN